MPHPNRISFFTGVWMDGWCVHVCVCVYGFVHAYARYIHTDMQSNIGHASRVSYGYWCSAHPNRTASGALTHRWPSGLAYKDVLPNAPYEHPEGAIVHTCRGGANCWFTW